MSQLIGIARRKKKKAPMEVLPEAAIGLDFGVEGDFRGKPGKRQITVLSKSAWDTACAELSLELDWTHRRANLLIDDIVLQDTAGKYLIIGEVQLLITKETDPCERMEEVHAGLFSALAKDWRGGVCCRVISPGVIKAGDSVEIKDPI